MLLDVLDSCSNSTLVKLGLVKFVLSRVKLGCLWSCARTSFLLSYLVECLLLEVLLYLHVSLHKRNPRLLLPVMGLNRNPPCLGIDVSYQFGIVCLLL